MANWPPEVKWHERDVVVPAFRQWLEAQGWKTETEAGFVDVVARRGNETIYAEVKGRTKGRPGAGLDTLYGQLLRRMPAEEVGDPNTRFAVVVPTGAEAAALRVPRRVRDVLRIDVYAVSDDGQVERVADEPDGGRVNIVPQIIDETEMARRVKRPSGSARQPRVTEEQFYAQMRKACRPELAERVLALYEHAKAHRSRQKFGLQSTTVWLGEHKDAEIANPLTLIFSWNNGGEISMRFVHLREQRTAEEMERLVDLLRRLPGTSEVLDKAVAKGHRTSCIFRAERVLATDEDLEAFKRVLDEAAVRATATD